MIYLVLSMIGLAGGVLVLGGGLGLLMSYLYPSRPSPTENPKVIEKFEGDRVA